MPLHGNSQRRSSGVDFNSSRMYIVLLSCLVLIAQLDLAAASAPRKVGNYVKAREGGAIAAANNARMPTACDVAIVGGGIGGMYAAYRLLSGRVTVAGADGGGPPRPPRVCMFEATDRVGGRIFSLRGMGGRGDLCVDVGAYRYVDGRHTLVQGVVENLLGLGYTQYDPASATFRKLVDGAGDDVGFVSAVEGLAAKAQELGLQLFLNAAVTRVDRLPPYPVSGNTSSSGAASGPPPKYVLTVYTTSGKAARVAADRVIFNVPQRPLMRILQASNLATFTPWSRALDMPFPYMAAKMYLYYEDTWWIYMNLTTGSFASPAFDTPNVNDDPTLFTEPPMRARYHDGDWKCDGDGDSDGGAGSSGADSAADGTPPLPPRCHGFLLYTYASDITLSGNSYKSGQGLTSPAWAGVVPRFYWNIAVNPDMSKPYVILDATTNSGAQLLSAAHRKLVAYHQSVGKPIPEPYASTLPTQALAVVWDPSVFWTGGAWHGYKNGQWGGQVNTSADANPATSTPVAAIKPWAGEQLFVVNEAFAPSSFQGWAEGSLILAENVVTTHFGAARPAFLPPARHDCVLFATYNHNSTLCSLSLNPLVQGQTRRRRRQARGVGAAHAEQTQQ
ncbi:hypothetical protein HXX76_009820 [Chlamydomonas incerta]|uniref:Amine oxidase domain-containing protein n=1 Tax=Chlamydomonas incerta TaxID=51695 RepID=A0A835SS53_CHLIN|nr:hypothetical protein HXX76_009820 [Chlamydomonas incerta]|eukprot:KAG2430846.1 hypothetical protein HXX76_009820 [Chlamydomonas incerta]